MTISFSGKRKGMEGSAHLIMQAFVWVGSFHMFLFSYFLEPWTSMSNIYAYIPYFPFQVFHSMERDVNNSYEAVQAVLEL